jgi:hypothetical protein
MQLCDLYKEKILGFHAKVAKGGLTQRTQREVSHKGRKESFHAKVAKGGLTQRTQREVSCKDRKGHSEIELRK